MSEQKQYFSTADVAERYDITERAVRKWIDKGYLPGSQKTSPSPTARWRIPQSALDFFEEKRQEASAS